jgi:hypothetical protein
MVAGVFSIVVALLMGAARFQLAARPSLEIPALERMRSDLRDRPNDAALRQEIRDLDLLARRAYFTNLNALQTGGVLLLVGVLATLGSLRIAVVLRRRLPDPRQYGPAPDPWENTAADRWSLAGAAVILVVAAAVLALSVGRDLRARPLASAQGTTSSKPLNPFVVRANPPVAEPVAAAGEEEMLKNWPCFRGPGGIGIAGVRIDRRHADQLGQPPGNRLGTAIQKIQEKVAERARELRQGKQKR